jgi:hypothetical protein
MEKKLQYISDSLITPYIHDKHPEWAKLIKAYCEYLDGGFFNKVINITDNTSADDIYSELLPYYMNNYFEDVINLDKYGLTDDNQRLFLSLSKFITGLKGNKKSLDFLFNSLTNFRFPTEGTILDIDNIEVEYEENEDWWIEGIIRRYNGAFDHDGVEVYNSEFAKPFTYRLIADQPYATLIELIRSVHPAGFNFEFLTKFNFEDSIELQDTINMDATFSYYYNFPDKTHAYNGAIDYDGTYNYGKYHESVTGHYYNGEINYSGGRVESLEF